MAIQRHDDFNTGCRVCEGGQDVGRALFVDGLAVKVLDCHLCELQCVAWSHGRHCCSVGDNVGAAVAIGAYSGFRCALCVPPPAADATRPGSAGNGHTTRGARHCIVPKLRPIVVCRARVTAAYAGNIPHTISSLAFWVVMLSIYCCNSHGVSNKKGFDL